MAHDISEVRARPRVRVHIPKINTVFDDKEQEVMSRGGDDQMSGRGEAESGGGKKKTFLCFKFMKRG